MVSGLVEFVTFPGPREIPFPTLNYGGVECARFYRKKVI